MSQAGPALAPGSPAGAGAVSLRRVRRSRLIALVLVGLVVFLVISALLARAFSVDSAERSAITAVVTDEAHGNAAAAVAAITGCRSSPSCRAGVAGDVSRLRHAGAVAVLQITTSSGFSLGPTHGTARVAWTAGGSLPIVQCLRVRHSGNVLSGFHVQLLVLSRRIASSKDCPKTY